MSTQVGYCGGDKQNPTYRDMGDHSESLLVRYDPEILSYEDILEEFLAAHDPTARRTRQYASFIFPRDKEQRERAEKVLAATGRKLGLGRGLATEILPDRKFWPAEDYHQKYYLSMYPDLLAEYRACYPDSAKLFASTAVARLNGYLAGYGMPEDLERDLERLGLSDRGAERLRALVGQARMRSLF